MKHVGKLRLKIGSSTGLQVSDDDVAVQIGLRSPVLKIPLVAASPLYFAYISWIALIAVFIQAPPTYFGGDIHAR